jgi:ABC-2 type transport system ATP-binding protein
MSCLFRTVSPVTDTDLVVEASGVTKWYGETTALDRVDFRVGPGQIHGLLGPNGAGKTTLLSVLFGLTLPDEGTLRLFGRTRAQAGSGWLDGVGGFVEAPAFYPYLSGRRNLEVLAGLDGGDAARLVGDLLDLAGLAGVAGRKVRGYSLGMRQRLGLAASLLRRPRLLILDEPTNGMDPAGIRDLRAALRRLAQHGVCVIVSSHDMRQVEEICDSVTVLNHGQVAFAGHLDTMRAGAPEPAWRLLTSDDDAATEEAAAMQAATEQAAAEQAATEQAATDPGDLKAARDDRGGLLVIAGQASMDAYVLRLGRAGVAVRGLSLDVTPLEAMFFHLTEDVSAERASAPQLAAEGT